MVKVPVNDYDRKVLNLVNSTRVVYASSDEISKVTIQVLKLLTMQSELKHLKIKMDI